MEVETPVKIYAKCFCCFNAAKTLYSVHGRKFMGDPIYGETIDELVGPGTMEKLQKAGVSICRSCYMKVFNVAVLKEKLAEGVAEITNNETSRPNVSQKRMANTTQEQMSFETPSHDTNETSLINHKRTRKSLFSSQVDVNEVDQCVRPSRAQQLLKRLQEMGNETKHDDIVKQEILDPLQKLRRSNVLVNMRPLTRLQSCQEFSLDLLEEISKWYTFK